MERSGFSQSAPETMVTPAESDPPLALRVNDLKQYAYCARVTFYRLVLSPDFKSTYKMDRGKLEQQRIERLESRRGLRRFGLEKARRRFHVWLGSERLGLSGVVDMLLETETATIPVDFKMTDKGPGHNHRIQLAAYALLLEESSGMPVETGFIYQIPLEKVVVVELTRELKERVLEMMSRIRTMTGTQCLPQPTKHRGRCVECEFRNYCGDIF